MQSQNHARHYPAAGRGRGNAQRPGSRKGAAPATTTAAGPVRKIFNCICDDTALVAGVKKSTRNGIRQWVKNGQIRLFVPLHALEQLDGRKTGASRHAEDVRETLHWLDEATSEFPHAITLQGGFETYENWTEVERFTVPKSLFSERDTVDEDLGMAAASKLNINQGSRKESMSSTASGISNPLSSQQSVGSPASAISPPTSPAKAAVSPVRYDMTSSATVSGGVPILYRPLFNYILWRIHQEHDPIAALESFIFLCNDDSKVAHAKGFDIRTKRLEQLREAINREDRDFRNRLSLAGKASQHVLNPTAPAVQPLSSDGAVEISINRTPPLAPAAMVSQQPGMMDPDSFGREPQMQATPPQNFVAPRSPRQPSTRNFHQPPPGNPAVVPDPPFQPRGNMRGSSMRGAGRGGSGRGRGAVPQPQGPVIDPNSFSRPRSGGFTGRGGQARKLWVPS